MSCVGLLPSDVEFLLSSDKSFYCKACSNSRRDSIRSPPPIVVLDGGATNISNITESGLSTNATVKSFTTVKHRDNNTNEPNNNQQITLGSVYNVIVSLRAENAHMLNAITALCEENKNLVSITESMHSDMLAMQRTLQEKDDVITLLKTEFNDLRSCVNAAVDKLVDYNKPITVATANACLPTLQISPDACYSSASVHGLPINLQSPAVVSDALSSACSLSVPANALSSAVKESTSVDALLSNMQSAAVDNVALSSVNFPSLPGACAGAGTVSSLKSKKAAKSRQRLMPSAETEITTASPQHNASKSD